MLSKTNKLMLLLVVTAGPAVGRQPCRWSRPIAAEVDFCSTQEVAHLQIKPLNASSVKTAPDAQIAFKPVRPDQQVSPGRFQWGPALQQSAQFLAVPCAV
jgi:hypothetical protein